MSELTTQHQELPDIQSLEDSRKVAIDRVGVSHVRHPVVVTDTDGTSEPVVATFKMTVSLPGDVKGTHMSRFLQVLSEHQERLGPGRLDSLVTDLRSTLNAEIAQVDMAFPWFVAKPAPITGRRFFQTSAVVPPSSCLGILLIN